MNESLKIVLAILALLLAFVFTFIFPGSGVEQIIVGILTIAGTYLGIDWRKQYDELKTWFKSKTIVGSLLYAIPLLAYLVLPLLGVAIPEPYNSWVVGIVGIGGLTFMLGVINAVVRKSKIPGEGEYEEKR